MMAPIDFDTGSANDIEIERCCSKRDFFRAMCCSVHLAGKELRKQASLTDLAFEALPVDLSHLMLILSDVLAQADA